MSTPDLSVDLETRTPNVARTYNYILGGSEHFAADRELGDRVLSAVPETRPIAKQNRELLQRMVRFLAAERGIRRFLDIGAGLPCDGQVHEVAQKVDPGARVVYVDHDPVVILQSQVMLMRHPRVTCIRGDVREPEEILSAPEVHELLAPGEPVGLLLFAVMQFVVDDEEAYRSVGALVDALPPGSAVAVSHPTTEVQSERFGTVQRLYRDAATAASRSREGIARFLDGLEMVDPGIVPVGDWRPDDGGQDQYRWHLGGLAFKP